MHPFVFVLFFVINFIDNIYPQDYMYRIVIGSYHKSGFMALMKVSRLCYIAILKPVLPPVHYNDANVNIYIFME